MTEQVLIEYKKAAQFLDDTLKFGIKPGLARINELCYELGSPQATYPSVLITGTNGKTSTTKMISALLSSHGYKVGTYTSPHLNRYTERMEINGEEISEPELTQLLAEILSPLRKVEKKLGENLTNFEILTALAFLYFQKQRVDCAVCEVGMGGRWDATTLSQPKVSVITNVALDHTNILGKTIKEIAWEKAHIIKNGTKTVISPLEDHALEEIRKRCHKVKVPLFVGEKDFFLISQAPQTEKSQKIWVKGIYGKEYRNLILPLVGKHQAINATLALAVAECFHGRPLDNQRIKRNLKELKCPGREEIVGRFPTVLLDGAHNQAGAHVLKCSLQSEFTYDRLILVLAIFKDKDIRGIVKELAPLASLVILSENKESRCASVDTLLEKANSISNYLVQPRLEQAIDLALEQASPSDLICIAGSLTTAAQAGEYLKRLNVSGDRE